MWNQSLCTNYLWITTWISKLQLLNMYRNSLYEVKKIQMQSCCYLDLIITTYKLHLPASKRLQGVEHKSELRCFAFLISACEIIAKQRSWSSCKSKATKPPPCQGAGTAYSSTERLCSKLPLRTWWITTKGIK